MRSLVVVEPSARVMLIESHEGPADSDYQVNAVLELSIGEGAHVDHVKLIGEGEYVVGVAKGVHWRNHPNGKPAFSAKYNNEYSKPFTFHPEYSGRPQLQDSTVSSFFP